MRVDARHHGQEARITGSHHSDPSVVASDVLDEPLDRVVGVGALVCCVPILVISERAHHHEVALALVSSANIFGDIDVAVARQLRALAEERRAAGSIHTVWRALHQDRERRGDVCRLQNHCMKLDPIAHRDHCFAAHIIVKDVTDRRAGSDVGGSGRIRDSNGNRVAGRIEGKGNGRVECRDIEDISGNRNELGRSHARRFDGEAAILNEKAVAFTSLDGIRVFARERLEFWRGGWLRGLS